MTIYEALLKANVPTYHDGYTLFAWDIPKARTICNQFERWMNGVDVSVIKGIDGDNYLKIPLKPTI